MINKEEIYSFLKSNGFRISEDELSDHFGDCYTIFINDLFEIRFSSSKSWETIDIRNIKDKENWYDLSLVKDLLYKEDNLSEPADIAEHIEFLKKNLEYITEVFSKHNYLVTKNNLDILEKKRTGQIFPKIM